MFNLWVGKIPLGREWLPIPAFLPGESHGQRNLAGYSPWGCKHGLATNTFNEKIMKKTCGDTYILGFPGNASGKELACQCRRGKSCGFNQSTGREDPLEDGMATHSSILA